MSIHELFPDDFGSGLPNNGREVLLDQIEFAIGNDFAKLPKALGEHIFFMIGTLIGDRIKQPGERPEQAVYNIVQKFGVDPLAESKKLEELQTATLKFIEAWEAVKLKKDTPGSL